MKKKHTMEERRKALDVLNAYKGKILLGTVNSVSRSGMSRRIEYYAADGNNIRRIGWYMAIVAGLSYDVDKGGILANGCGQDMIWNCIYLTNLAAKRLENPDMDNAEFYKDHTANTNYLFPEHYSR